LPNPKIILNGAKIITFLNSKEYLSFQADPTDPTAAGSIIYDTDAFRTDTSGAITFVNANGLPPGTIVIQRRIPDDKGSRLLLKVSTSPSRPCLVSPLIFVC